MEYSSLIESEGQKEKNPVNVFDLPLKSPCNLITFVSIKLPESGVDSLSEIG